MIEYWIAKNEDGLEKGPFSIDAVRAMLDEGDLCADEDYVWYETLPDWLPIKEAPGLARHRIPTPLPALEPAEAVVPNATERSADISEDAEDSAAQTDTVAPQDVLAAAPQNHRAPAPRPAAATIAPRPAAALPIAAVGAKVTLEKPVRPEEPSAPSRIAKQSDAVVGANVEAEKPVTEKPVPKNVEEPVAGPQQKRETLGESPRSAEASIKPRGKLISTLDHAYRYVPGTDKIKWLADHCGEKITSPLDAAHRHIPEPSEPHGLSMTPRPGKTFKWSKGKKGDDQDEGDAARRFLPKS